MVFIKRPPLWAHASILVLIFVAGIVLVRGYGATEFDWFSIVMSGLTLLHLPRMIIDQFYIPKIGRLIVDEQGVRLEARRFSWRYDWSLLECAYIEKHAFGQKSLKLTGANGVEKIIPELAFWKPEAGELVSVADVVEKFIPVRPNSEMLMSQSLLGRDIGPAATRAVIIIGAALVFMMFAGVVVHRYYPLGGGTPMVLWILGGLLVAAATLFYLFSNYVHRSAFVFICILGFILGSYSVPVIFKSVVILSNDVQVHEFELVEKNGGYQYWRSRVDRAIEIELGSVANNIHTENEEGAILKLQLVNGRFMVLLLPDELEKTRYLVK